MHKNEVKNKVSQKVELIIQELETNEFGDAYSNILTMLLEYPDYAEPHNLLGIWNELQGNYDMARKHYRAGYALNPAYSPASNNLERLCMDSNDKNQKVDFGEKLLTV